LVFPKRLLLKTKYGPILPQETETSHCPKGLVVAKKIKVMKKVLKEMLSNPKELIENVGTLIMIGATVYCFYFIGYIFFG